MIKRVFLFALVLISISCSKSDKISEIDFTQWVDPYIGTDYHGHVFLGANVPFGAVQVGPTNYIRGWDWCSGYHYSDSVLVGFSQMHLSGTGIGDLGDVLVTPYTGKIQISPGSMSDPLGGYASLYSHEDETAKVGYYSVHLKNYDIQAELTSTNRVAFHKYSFPSGKKNRIAINLAMGIGWDMPMDCGLEKLNDTTFVGYRFSKGWAVDQQLYFAVHLSKPAQEFKLYNRNKTIETLKVTGDSVVGILSFGDTEEQVMMKVGISHVSKENALENIAYELPGWDFNQVVKLSQIAWNKELSKIKIKTDDQAQLRTFYTAMYHSFIAPITFSDVNKEYKGADGKTHKNTGFENYSVLSLWDTYRAAHPMYTIVQPERVSDLVNTMLAIYQQQGKLPIWHLVGNETNCMIGYSAVPVVADAFLKGFTGFDKEIMFQSLKESSTRDDYGVKYLKEMGYIPADLEKESVAKALEYAISDLCIANVAQKMGEDAEYSYYMKRANAYKEYFDTNSKFMRAKLSNGKFKTPFDPFKSTHEWGDYTEGNAWQYTWLVPQDVEGLIELFEGDKKFTAKLDSLFIVEGDMGEHASPDISGLIGQYAQGNEPGHHIPYLYAYAGEQWKTAEKVRHITSTMYTDKPDGLCGNEDCAQMSAWYILSSLGLYQVNPAGGAFVFGSPLFDEVAISLPEGEEFIIKAVNNSPENKYIQSALLNGEVLNRTYITYREIMSGGILEFKMGNQPEMTFGASKESRPKSIVYE